MREIDDYHAFPGPGYEGGRDPMTDRPKERVARELQEEMERAWRAVQEERPILIPWGLLKRILEALRSGGEEPRVAEAYEMIQDVFRFLNQYGEDPYNMGGDPRQQASISPHAIIAEVYARLAPLHGLLKEMAPRPSTETDAPGEGEDGCPKCGGQSFVTDRYGVWCGNENCRAPVGRLLADPDEGSGEGEEIVDRVLQAMGYASDASTKSFDDLGMDTLDRTEFVIGLEEEAGIDIPDEDWRDWAWPQDGVRYVNRSRPEPTEGEDPWEDGISREELAEWLSGRAKAYSEDRNHRAALMLSYAAAVVKSEARLRERPEGEEIGSYRYRCEAADYEFTVHGPHTTPSCPWHGQECGPLPYRRIHDKPTEGEG